MSKHYDKSPTFYKNPVRVIFALLEKKIALLLRGVGKKTLETLI